MAREIGDTTTWDRLRTVSESQFEPRYLGDGDSRFAFWLGETSPWPRGQINATMMVIECAEPGAWSRVFSAPNTSMYDEPTVRDLDYPRIGVRRTHHDERRHVLEVDTYAATASQRGTLRAAAGEDTAALVGSGWVAEADLAAAAAPPFTPAAITYQPLAEAGDPDVVLVRLSAKGLMTLHSAVPGLTLASKPQCMIVPLAQSGHVAVSPGCAVSRTRTGLPPGR